MPHAFANNVRLYYEASGEGEPLVLVHGGWSDHGTWQAVVPGLARMLNVVAYDRRGHGASQRGDQGSRREQEDDLAALIEALELAPAHVAGTSFGGSIVIGLAARRPELFRSLTVHEPPLMSVVAGDPEVEPLIAEVQATIDSVLARVARGDADGAARQFVEEVALGPGAWELLPQPLRATMIDTAAAVLAEQQDAGWADVDLAALARIECPVLLTQGDQSPHWFLEIVARLAEAIHGAQVHTYRGAGHAPHLTNPGDYLAAVTEFFARTREEALVA